MNTSKYKFSLDDRATAKAGLISLSIFTVIGIGLCIWSYIFYDDYSELVQNYRGRVSRSGIAPTIFGITLFAIPLFAIGIFILSKTRDFKQIGIGIGPDNIFLNKDGIKATTIPYSNIARVDSDEFNIMLDLNDYAALISNQFGLFKGKTKKKYITNGESILISKDDFKGEEDAVLEYLQEKVKSN